MKFIDKNEIMLTHRVNSIFCFPIIDSEMRRVFWRVDIWPFLKPSDRAYELLHVLYFWPILAFFVKEFLLLLATQQHLINTSANASVSTPNHFNSINCKRWIDINSRQMNYKLQHWIELIHVNLFYKTFFKC